MFTKKGTYVYGSRRPIYKVQEVEANVMPVLPSKPKFEPSEEQLRKLWCFEKAKGIVVGKNEGLNAAFVGAGKSLTPESYTMVREVALHLYFRDTAKEKRARENFLQH